MITEKENINLGQIGQMIGQIDGQIGHKKFVLILMLIWTMI